MHIQEFPTQEEIAAQILDDDKYFRWQPPADIDFHELERLTQLGMAELTRLIDG
jgi:hypothetical protein